VTEISLTYEDKIELGIETEILLKFRGTLLASLPISLTVSLVNLKGTVDFYFPQPLIFSFFLFLLIFLKKLAYGSIKRRRR